MLQRVLNTLRKTKVDGIVVVLGAYEQEVRRSVKFDKERVVSNAGYAEGMSSSLKSGLTAASDADAVIVALADQPFLTAATVNRLIEEHLESKAPIVMPVYKGRRGNPVLFDKNLFQQIMKIHGDVGAKSLIEKNKDVVLEVTVKDKGVVVDLDTRRDYRNVMAS